MKHLKKFKLFEGLAIGGMLLDGNPLKPFKDDIQDIINNIAEDVCGTRCSIIPGTTSKSDRLVIHLYRDLNALETMPPEIDSKKFCTDQEFLNISTNVVNRFKDLLDGIAVHYGLSLLAEFSAPEPDSNRTTLEITCLSTDTKLEDYDSEEERKRINEHYEKALGGGEMYQDISLSHIKILLNI